MANPIARAPSGASHYVGSDYQKSLCGRSSGSWTLVPRQAVSCKMCRAIVTQGVKVGQVRSGSGDTIFIRKKSGDRWDCVFRSDIRVDAQEDNEYLTTTSVEHLFQTIEPMSEDEFFSVAGSVGGD